MLCFILISILSHNVYCLKNVIEHEFCAGNSLNFAQFWRRIILEKWIIAWQLEIEKVYQNMKITYCPKKIQHCGVIF